MSEKRECTGCGKTVRVRKDGQLYNHHPNGRSNLTCMSDPAPTVDTMDDVQDIKGPWFGAMYDGECSSCDDAIYEGDSIRADGRGGYECRECDESLTYTDVVANNLPLPVGLADPNVPEIPSAEQFMDPAPVSRRDAAMRTLAAEGPNGDMASLAFEREQEEALQTLITPEQFMDPSPVGDAEPVISVSGQPKKVLRDHLDRYCVVLPGATELEVFKSSGNPVGRTRTTTFVKAAQDSKAINDWGKRNVVIGAARRRDLILKAHDLTHERDRDKLNSLVKELEAAAGAKVGSDLGSYLHEFTEYMDAGLKGPDDAPEEFQRSLWAYEQALLDAGLEPIRSLIERTTIIREYGWVCGTFDRIFYHRPSGQYVIGDLKTGKTMDYGKNEIECQLWVYAHGVNQNGIYDWNTRTWQPPGSYGDSVELGPWQVPQVSESVGVIIHMPVQGPKEGTVELLWADLESGAAHAEVCGQVRARPGGRMKPWGDGPAALRPLTWHEQFAAVTSPEDANRLWRLAKADGVAGLELQELVGIARQAIAVRG